MKTDFFKIQKTTNHPLYVQYHHADKFYGRFHFHDEIQITYIKQGKGIFVCGSNSYNFESQNVLIFGSRLPHILIADNNVYSESISVYFKEEWLKNLCGDNFFIQHFLNMSRRGVKVNGISKPSIFEDLLNQSGLYSVKLFIELLDDISNSPKDVLNKSAFEFQNYQSEISGRFSRVQHYITQNFTKEISLSSVAEIAHMTPEAFCRYFKQKTDKTLSKYLMELRVELACQLLKDDNNTVESIAYQCGYNNFSNFLRQFKKIKNVSPTVYKKQSLNL